MECHGTGVCPVCKGKARLDSYSDLETDSYWPYVLAIVVAAAFSVAIFFLGRR